MEHRFKDGTPKTLKLAVENALQELLTHRVYSRVESIEAVYEHIRERLAQDFNIAELKGETPKQTFERIFPKS